MDPLITLRLTNPSFTALKKKLLFSKYVMSKKDSFLHQVKLKETKTNGRNEGLSVKNALLIYISFKHTHENNSNRFCLLC